MPNHVRNVLKFKNLTKDDIDNVLSLVATKADEVVGGYYFDFDKIIPEPREEHDCPDACKVNKSSHVELDKERPWFDWYTWRVKYWGTKWGSYDCATIIGKSYITFVFSTAWAYPEPIIDRLHLLGYDIEYRYADESLGYNCGKITYTDKEGWDVQDDHLGLPNPRDFARRLWSSY